MSKTFAPEYQRDEHGWIRFPRDDQYRKVLFPPETNQHPAKANVYLVQAIIEYVSDADDTIMDIMAGTGTILVGALIGRKVICVEISEKFYAMQLKAVEIMSQLAPGLDEQVSCFNMPCQVFLPIADIANHIIFSPQYAGILKTKGTDDWNRDMAYDFQEYSKSPLNLGTMSEFLWTHEMERVYRKCYDSLVSPGSMTLIVKDHMRDGKRVGLTKRATDSCMRVGFKHSPLEHFKWAAPGMAYTSMRKSKGIEVVEDEDIIVLRKE